jgi:predicted transcriptional regulator
VVASTGQINPAALAVAQAARLLGVAEQTIRDHVAAGAPTAADGRINLVHYAAWLNRELKTIDAD